MLFRKEDEDSLEFKVKELSVTDDESLFSADDLQYFIKAPASVFQSMNLFKRWKSHCKEQYWYYRTWFMDWCYSNQCQNNLSQHAIGSDGDATITACTDGETAPTNNDCTLKFNSASDAKSTNDTKGKSLLSSYHDKGDEKDPNNPNPIKLKKEHELDFDETGQGLCCSDTEEKLDCDKLIPSNQEDQLQLGDIDFSTTCSAMGYRFSTYGCNFVEMVKNIFVILTVGFILECELF